MEPQLPQYDIGVIVGRFQVHELHDAHRDLIQYVVDRHEKVIIVLGVSPLMVSTNNPLDFESRKQMILAEFPQVNVVYLMDTGDDPSWSRNLDKLIGPLATPGQTTVIYGGRDSFIGHYEGRYPTRELTQAVFQSGTVVRRAIARSSTRATEDFRAGVIWASQARFPTAYQCVDVAVIKQQYEPGFDTFPLVLMGRKANERLMRFPGGFSDPRSKSLEEDARREVAEETTVEVGDLKYIGSTVVEDWRYRNEPDCIKTALFVGTYIHGRPTPSDDLDGEVRWLDASAIRPNEVVPSHRPLLAMLQTYLKEN